MFIRCRSPNFLIKKTLDFSEIMLYIRMDKGVGVKKCGHFATKGREVNFFAILCGRILWTIP